MVFFFNVPFFGRLNGVWNPGLPLSSWAPGQAGDPSKNQYGGIRREVVSSIWIDGDNGCPDPAGHCAVFISDDPTILGTDTSICFVSSVEDTTEKDSAGNYKYSLECDGSTSISDATNTMILSPVEYCENSGVVQNCNP